MVISFKIIIGGNEWGDRWKKSYELVTVEAEYKRIPVPFSSQGHKSSLGRGRNREREERGREGGREGDKSECQYLFYLKENSPEP